MTDNMQDKVKALDKEFIIASVMEMPGVILVSLAAYAKFGANGHPFHPALADKSFIWAMFIIGSLIIASSFSKILSIAKRRKELTNAQSS